MTERIHKYETSKDLISSYKAKNCFSGYGSPFGHTNQQSKIRRQAQQDLQLLEEDYHLQRSQILREFNEKMQQNLHELQERVKQRIKINNE